MLNIFIKMLRLSITEISRGGSVDRDSQPDKTILPTKKPTREMRLKTCTAIQSPQENKGDTPAKQGNTKVSNKK